MKENSEMVSTRENCAVAKEREREWSHMRENKESLLR